MKSKKRSLETTISFKGKLLSAVTVSGLAEIVGKSRDTILRYEREGTFPIAPFKLGAVRYYPTSLAERLKPLVARLPGNTRPPAELVAEIALAFKEEVQKCQK